MKTTIPTRKSYLPPVQCWWQLRVENFCESGNLPSQYDEDPLFDEDFN